MSIVQTITGLALRQVMGEGAEHVIRMLEDRMTDHGQRLVRALQQSNERAWRALEIALAGETLWNRFDRADERIFRQQIRTFLELIPLPLLTGKAEFRRRCLRDLQSARKQALLGGALQPEEIRASVGPFATSTDPQELVKVEQASLQTIVATLQQQGFPDLAHLLAQDARPEQSLLIVAVRYFFRREVEADSALARGLIFTHVQELSHAQEEGFQKLDTALHHHGQRIEEALGNVLEAVLDLQAEMKQQMHHLGQQMKSDYENLHDQVRQLVERLQMQGRPLRAGDSLCLHNEREYQLVKQLLETYRKLPEEEQRNSPALLNGLGKLQVAVGEFTGAHDSFARVATVTGDRPAQAEARYNAYRAALEAGQLESALAELRQALQLDPGRYAPFPPDDYDPLRILGAGGFGVTFLCRHRLTGGEVAVKALASEGLERDLGTLLQEAAALETLRHPAIIRLRHCGFADPARTRPYLVMEYFPGPTLEQYVQQNGPLPLDQALKLAAPVAHALQAAHRHGILHRDIKPANLLVLRSEDRWEVRLIDFGLALKQSLLGNSLQATQRGRTIVGQSIAGTLDYAAPEQLGKLPGARVGPQADIYGFARTLCFALFETAEPTYLDWQRLPPALAELLAQCLVRKPEQRPGDFRAVLNRLQLIQTQATPVRLTPLEEESPPSERIAPPLAPVVVDDEPSLAPVELAEESLPPMPRPIRLSEERLLSVLRRFQGQDDLYLAPNIPSRKLANACVSCALPPGEKILALIDSTVFGSARNALLLGLEGIYYHNDWTSKKTGVGAVLYRDFPQREFVRDSWSEVGLDCGQFFNRSGSNVTSQTIVEILNAIKALIEKI